MRILRAHSTAWNPGKSVRLEADRINGRPGGVERVTVPRVGPHAARAGFIADVVAPAVGVELAQRGGDRPDHTGQYESGTGEDQHCCARLLLGFLTEQLVRVFFGQCSAIDEAAGHQRCTGAGKGDRHDLALTAARDPDREHQCDERDVCTSHFGLYSSAARSLPPRAR